MNFSKLSLQRQPAFLSGVVEGDKACDDSFVSLEEDAEELEGNKNVLDNC